MMSTARQICAACAAVAGAASAGALVLVAAGTPGLRISGSVSQLGATGQPMAGTYQAAVLGIAVAVCLLAFGIAPVSRLAAAALAGTTVLGAVSAAVPCTPGCPLPPTSTATSADVAHVIASTAAFVLVAWAMLLLARSGTDRLARLSRSSVVLVTALGTPVGVALVATGEGLLNGVLERAMMAVALAWQVVWPSSPPA
jgi:hypothetical protein